MRLIDMGVDGYLVASSVRAVVAQRLVRRICDVCQTEHQPTDQENAILQQWLVGTEIPSQFYAGRGCSRCNMTGYRGRIGVFEFLESDEAMRNALRNSDAAAFARAAQQSANYVPLNRAALAYAGEGVTTLDEVMRVSETETI